MDNQDIPIWNGRMMETPVPHYKCEKCGKIYSERELRFDGKCGDIHCKGDVIKLPNNYF